MPPDLWSLYGKMIRSRLFEAAVAELWRAGLIAGEMHLGTGEEAICAGVVDHLTDGDAMALDHRGTPPLLMRGVEPVLLLQEFLGHPGGLCAGLGGHMHLFARELLAASSGIVGASGPAAVGFALAARQLRPGKVAVAFFGEGAMNQGMLLEALNLALVWMLPVVFVCKDNDWAIATVSTSVSGSDPGTRARGFGLPTASVDGLDVIAVWNAAQAAVERARHGNGPSFVHARCIHLDGHFLGDRLLEAARSPFRQWRRTTEPVVRAVMRPRGAAPGSDVVESPGRFR